MWEFIKNCLYCACIVFSGIFGTNPPGLTWNSIVAGSITLFVLLGLALLILYIIVLIINRFR